MIEKKKNTWGIDGEKIFMIYRIQAGHTDDKVRPTDTCKAVTVTGDVKTITADEYRQIRGSKTEQLKYMSGHYKTTLKEIYL